MSETATRPEITGALVFADYAAVDPLGKVNIIGAGIRVLQRIPPGPTTQPCAVVAMLTSPQPTPGDAPAVELVLTDPSGRVVHVGRSDAPPQAIRVGQILDFPPPTAPGIIIPRHALPSSASFAVNFNTGLPLEPGTSYQWRLQVDHDVVATYSFYVAVPPPPPTIG